MSNRTSDYTASEQCDSLFGCCDGQKEPFDYDECFDGWDYDMDMSPDEESGDLEGICFSGVQIDRHDWHGFCEDDDDSDYNLEEFFYHPYDDYEEGLATRESLSTNRIWTGRKHWSRH